MDSETIAAETTSARIQADDLRHFVVEIFEAAGVPPDQAEDAADVLIWANRRGVDTHGIRNLKRFYIDRIVEGTINPRPEFRIDHETPTSARVDGDAALGMVAGCWAMRLAMSKAARAGIGLVTMHNSNHYGAAGYYPTMAIDADMIGVSMTGFMFAQGSDLGVRPTFGARPMLSTNPISIAFPTQSEPPFVLDMATSVVPMNRIEMMAENGRQAVPAGWGCDESGAPSTDPEAIRQLLPLGGTREQGSHKGFGLAMMVEVLCAGLSGGWFQGAESGAPASDGYGQDSFAHFFAAMRVDAFRPVSEFKQGMDAMIRSIHASQVEPGQERIYVAGEIEHEVEQKRLQHGIPVPTYIRSILQSLSEQYSIPLPDPVHKE